MTPEAARTHVAAAERELAVLHDRRKQAMEREQAAAGTRAKVADLRAKAEEVLANPEAINPDLQDIACARAEYEVAEEAYQLAKLRMEVAKANRDALDAKYAKAKGLMEEADRYLVQASELEDAISGEDTGDLSDAMATAEAAKVEAMALVARAEATAKWTAAKTQVTVAECLQADADAAWLKLDTIVKTLTVVAPAEIASRADLVAGLEVTPDSIMLDGKDITVLCGAEKMRFAVTLAKRVAGKAKMLTVDGLEQIAPAKRPEFVRMCLEGGWMLFGTLVSDGAMVVVDCYTFAKAA
jgi:hypothetical protein